MLHVADMKEGTNDNDTWQPLSLATRRLLETCEQKKSDCEREAQNRRSEEQKKEDEREYIEQRLREIAAFEEWFRPGQAF